MKFPPFLRFRIPSLDTAVHGAIGLVLVVAVGLLVWAVKPRSITVSNLPGDEQIDAATSAVTGLPCSDPHRRPIAVMLASDPEARPLSGLAAADMVFEMPVTPNGITRMMAVYQCGNDPSEIGSIRSARQDFIPLAQGMNAMLAHWGGEHAALAQLNNHIVDNIDALAYEGSIFYRKKKVPAPHNGFSTLTLIREKAEDLGYPASTSITPYTHQAAPQRTPNLAALVDTVTVRWPQNMDVRFQYDPETKTYLRWRGGTPEMDATTAQQVRASVIAIANTDASFVRDQYISVRTVGQGPATIYQQGTRTSGTWKKQGASGMLVFLDDRGTPIPLAPGSIWVLFDAILPQP